MKSGTVVAARLLNKKWVVATISEAGNLTKKKSIETLSAVKDDGFIALKQYLKIMKLEADPVAIMDKLGAISLYVQHEPEGDMAEAKGLKAIEKAFWAKMNELCRSCKGKCKQSSRVDVIMCPSFTKV